MLTPTFNFFFLNFIRWTDFNNPCHKEVILCDFRLPAISLRHVPLCSTYVRPYRTSCLACVVFSYCFIYESAVSLALIEFSCFWCHIGFLNSITESHSQTQCTCTSSLTPLLSVLTLKHWFRGVCFTPSGILAINVQKRKRGTNLYRKTDMWSSNAYPKNLR